MEKMTGGQWTKGGIYVSLRTGEFITVPKDGGELPGEASVRYARMPAAIAAVLGPVVGLAYVIFLPAVGLITLAWIIGRLISRGLGAMKLRTKESEEVKHSG